MQFLSAYLNFIEILVEFLLSGLIIQFINLFYTRICSMTRKYIKVNEDQRAHLAALCNQGLTIKQASDQTGIPYENAKAIIRVMRKQDIYQKQVTLSLSVHKISKSSKQASLTILNARRRTSADDNSPL